MTPTHPYDLGSYEAEPSLWNAAKLAQRCQKNCWSQGILGPGGLIVKNGVSCAGSPGKSIPVAEVVQSSVSKKGSSISGRGHFVDTLASGADIVAGYLSHIPTFAFATQMAEVEVDPETGKVNVLKIVAAHDTGTVINPMSAEGQSGRGPGFGCLMENSQSRTVENSSFLIIRYPPGIFPTLKRF
jgi:hypothetical protein